MLATINRPAVPDHPGIDVLATKMTGPGIDLGPWFRA